MRATPTVPYLHFRPPPTLFSANSASEDDSEAECVCPADRGGEGGGGAEGCTCAQMPPAERAAYCAGARESGREGGREGGRERGGRAGGTASVWCGFCGCGCGGPNGQTVERLKALEAPARAHDFFCLPVCVRARMSVRA